MKKTIAAFITGLILASTGTAIASTQFWGNSDVACKAYTNSVVCMRRDGRGYGVGISHEIATIMTTNGKRVVAVKLQP